MNAANDYLKEAGRRALQFIIHNSSFIIPAALCVAAAGCRTVPVSGRTQLMLSREASENVEGAAVYGEYLDKTKPTTDTRQQELLQRVGGAVRDAAEAEVETGFEWEFNVLESRTVNAFCLPGGKVAVYTGIMTKFANEAEMACVVAHEVGHALARHGGERVSWGYLQTIGSLGISHWLGGAAEWAYGLGTTYGVMLPYSRKHETEADLIGLHLMAKAGYDPRAAVTFWQRFGGGNNSLWDELTSTHPCDDTRVADLSARLPEAEETYRQCPNKRGLGVKLTNGIPAAADE